MFCGRVDTLLGEFRGRGLIWACNYAAASASIIRRNPKPLNPVGMSCRTAYRASPEMQAAIESSFVVDARWRALSPWGLYPQLGCCQGT